VYLYFGSIGFKNGAFGWLLSGVFDEKILFFLLLLLILSFE